MPAFQPVTITKSSLLKKLLELNKPIVLTKNKDEGSEKNFREDRKKSNVMLDGYWVGIPKRINKGDFCAHYIKQKAEFWIGTYDGSTPFNSRVQEKSQRYSLIMCDPIVYKIKDIDKPNPEVDSILIANFLHKNGTVTYTYFPGSIVATNHEKNTPQTSGADEFTGAEKIRLLSTRVNHGKLRNRTLKEFDGKCCISALNIPELLVCSHIKPWAESNATEKTDRNNVLLLAANWDSVFDKGLVSIQDDGEIIFSNKLSRDVMKLIGLSKNFKLDASLLTPARIEYLSCHRANIFISK